MDSRVIGIVSGKGGVGKTTLSINLAYALAKHFNKKTLLVGANITTSHLGISLGITHPPVTLNDLLRSTKKEANFVKLIDNLEILPSAISPTKLKGVDIAKISRVTKSLKSKYDFILLDSAPGLGREAISVLKASEEVLFITNPLTPAALDIIRVSEICGELRITSLGLVLNMVRHKPYELSAMEIERFTNVPVIAEIPFDKVVLKSLALRKPFVEVFPNSKPSKEVIRLAAIITGEILPQREISWMDRIKRFFKLFH